MESIIGYLIGRRLGKRLDRRRNERLRSEGKAAASIRGLPRFSNMWLSGDWDVAPGRLTLWRTTARIDGIDLEFRSPTGPESREVNPEARIYTASSGGATVEIALLPDQSDWVIERLGAAPS
ncbi:hypothetical protein [Promicromonospora aerolata]|uniref:Uncharacterized protein n=1 Tax=Promicromonospora aerolata TaxID=195749 RepID=A0ABW4V867_9MICO